jgi:polyvinyl alcohol dehydrogenase (cytochrome)
VDVLGIGEKSGIDWALNPDNGNVIWSTLVGPGSSLGGIEWGTAFDGKRIYVPIANLYGIPYALQPSGTMANGGSWAALDPATGKILWQIPVPGQCPSAIRGTAARLHGTWSGERRKRRGVRWIDGSQSRQPHDVRARRGDRKHLVVVRGRQLGHRRPAIVGDTIYWGSGYGRFGPQLGTSNNKLFAFSVGGKDLVTAGQ